MCHWIIEVPFLIVTSYCATIAGSSSKIALALCIQLYVLRTSSLGWLKCQSLHIPSPILINLGQTPFSIEGRSLGHGHAQSGLSLGIITLAIVQGIIPR